MPNPNYDYPAKPTDYSPINGGASPQKTIPKNRKPTRRGLLRSALSSR